MAGREPVASTKCFAVIVRPPTSSASGDTKRALPRMTSTPRLRKCSGLSLTAMPATTSATRAMTRASCGCGSAGASAKRSAWRIRCATRADLRSVFDGTEPCQRQSPPSLSFSIRAILAPSFAPRAATTRPPAPPPMTARSNSGFTTRSNRYVRSSSVKIARAGGQGPEHRRQIDEPASEDVHDVALPLDRAVDAEEPRAEELAPLPLADLAAHDDVRRAGFVLERDEDDAACRVGTLAADDDPCGAHEASMRRAPHGVGTDEPPLVQPAAQERQRMASQREAEAAVVGDDVLAFGGRRQRRLRFIEGNAGQKRRHAFHAGDVPHRIMAMSGKRRERIAVGQRSQVAPIETRAVREVGDAAEWALAARIDDACGTRFGEPAEEAQPEPEFGVTAASREFGIRAARSRACFQRTLAAPALMGLMRS